MAAAGGGGDGAYDRTNFVEVCQHGSVEDACVLLALTGEDRVDVHAEDGAAWRWACTNGHMDVVKLLLDLTGDRHIKREFGRLQPDQAGSAHVFCRNVVTVS